MSISMDLSDVDTALSFCTSSYSEYSTPPSEADVTMGEAAADELSLDTCFTSVSEYSAPPSEANVEVSQLEENLHPGIQSDVDSDATLIHSDYSLPPDEVDVNMDSMGMLYPQSYFTKLMAPERDGCDTRAPPQMSP